MYANGVPFSGPHSSVILAEIADVKTNIYITLTKYYRATIKSDDFNRNNNKFTPILVMFPFNMEGRGRRVDRAFVFMNYCLGHCEHD